MQGSSFSVRLLHFSLKFRFGVRFGPVCLRPRLFTGLRPYFWVQRNFLSLVRVVVVPLRL